MRTMTIGINAFLLAALVAEGAYRHVDVSEAPFKMDPVPEFVFPERRIHRFKISPWRKEIPASV